MIQYQAVNKLLGKELLVPEMPQVTIYSDGGADPNPGVGGWGVVLIHQSSGSVRELSGGEAKTTNNRMELTAAIEALRALKQPCRVIFYTDSQYVRRGVTEWMYGWKKKGWHKKNGDPVLNADLWQDLDRELNRHQIDWNWVKGHAGDTYNERAHQLATQGIRQQDGPVRRNPTEFEAYLLVSARGKKGYWGVLHRAADGSEEIYWAEEDNTSSNRLLLLAAFNALLATPDGASLTIYTTADYLRNGATKWIKGWQRRNWMTKKGDPVANADVWQEIADMMRTRNVHFPPVKIEEMQLEFEDVAERVREVIQEEMEQHAEDDSLKWAE